MIRKPEASGLAAVKAKLFRSDNARKTNYVPWIKEIELALCTTYGEVGTYFTTRKKYSPAEPVEDDWKLFDGATPEENRASKVKRYDRWKDECRVIASYDTSIFHYMMGQSSEDSKEEVGGHPNYREAVTKSNWPLLSEIIIETHLTGSAMSPDEKDRVKYHANEDLKTVLMDKSTTLTRYNELFHNQLRLCKALGCPDIGEKNLVYIYCGNLDQTRYGDTIREFKHGPIYGRAGYPATIKLCHEILKKVTIETTGVMKKQSVFFGNQAAGTDSTDEESQSTASDDSEYTTFVVHPKRSPTRGGSIKQKEQKEWKGKGSSPDRSSKQIICYKCGECGHNQRACKSAHESNHFKAAADELSRLRAEVRKANNSDTMSDMTADRPIERQKVALLTIGEFDEDDEGDNIELLERYRMFVTTSREAPVCTSCTSLTVERTPTSIPGTEPTVGGPFSSPVAELEPAEASMLSLITTACTKEPSVRKPCMSPTAAPQTKWYAVRIGSEPGIYERWEGIGGAKEQVFGHSGAIHKSFKSRQQAEVWMTDVPYNVYTIKLKPSPTTMNRADSLFSDPWLVLMDTQGGISVFWNKGLGTNVRKAKPVIIDGVNSSAEGMRVEHEMDFKDVGTVKLSPMCSANILSFGQCRDEGHTMGYDNLTDTLTMTTKSGSSWEFSRISDNEGQVTKHYGCRFPREETCTIHNMLVPDEYLVCVDSVRGNRLGHSKAVLARVDLARDYNERMGWPTVVTQLRINPTISGIKVHNEDIKTAVSIHGKLIAKLKGCSTKQHGPTPDYRPLLTSKGTRHDPQVLEIDLMYVQKVVFLLGVVHPMDYTVVAHLSKGESSAAIQPILEAMVNDLERNGVPISLIRSDPGTNLMKCKRVLQPGNTNNEYIQIDTTAAGEHAERVERKIRTTKERFRTGTNSLPFRLSLFMIVQLILFVVSCLNKETGAYSVYHRRGLDARLDYRVKFGQYVQATEANTDNTPAPRTQGCIALGGLDNLTGGVRMLSLSTLKVVRRNNFETLPMPDLVVDLMDNMAAKDLKDKLITPVAPSPAMDLERTGATQDQSDTGDMPLVPSPPVSTDPMRHPVDQGSEESPPVSTDNIRHPVDYTHEQSSLSTNTGWGATSWVPPIITTPSTAYDRGDNHPLAWGELASAVISEEPEPVQVRGGLSEYIPRPGGRTAQVDSLMHLLLSHSRPQDHVDTFYQALHRRRHWHDRQFALNMSVRQAIKTHGAIAEASIKGELLQMHDMKVWTPIKLTDIPKHMRKGILRTSIFLKEKFLSTGAFEKLKARLVAGGDQQDKSIYTDLSSPTASTASVFAVAALAAQQGREVMTIDITGAFLHASMFPTGIDVYVRIDKNLAPILASIDGIYHDMLNDDGTITVRLDKALYGCVEAAKLWYDELCGTLKDIGFTPNPEETCVFNKGVGESQVTIVLHVDDLLVTARDRKQLHHVADKLQAKYKKVQQHSGPIVSYLGLTMDFSAPGEVRITQEGYIDTLLTESRVEGTAKTPATEDLFVVRDGIELASEEDSKWFHRQTARLLYLSKRTKPEILVATAFLTTRVTKCDQDDLGKLRRLIRYVRSARDRGLCLKPGNEGCEVSIYIDAAYGVHSDCKSHTGSAIAVGQAILD